MTVTGEIKILTMSGEFKYLGDAGPSGPRGETGNGIQEIVKTDTQGLIDTYTITYTNGNTVTFTITNGRNGENGTDGRDGLTTSVNGIEQEGGNVDINLDNIPDGSIRKLITNTVNDLLNYYNKSETDILLNTKVDKQEGKSLISDTEIERLSNVHNYDDTEVKSDIEALETSKANITDIPTTTSELNNNSGFITNAVNNLLNYYLKSETYTKSEVNTLIGNIVTVQIVPVDVLPETGEANKIYLVPSSDPDTQNARDEYIWFNNEWELIGSTQIALVNYYTKSETNTLLNTKVDKVENKGLSTNDYTTEEKTKLAGLENYDDTQIQAEISNKNDLFQIVNVPENPADGYLMQYVSGTNEDYTYGHFYKFNQGSPEHVTTDVISEGITSATTDLEQFRNYMMILEEGFDYTFTYWINLDTSEGFWDFEMMEVNLADAGISYVGTPSEGDTITVRYFTETIAGWKEQEIQSGIQLSVIPTPSSKTAGKIFQYTGETYYDDMIPIPMSYTKGHFYETVEEMSQEYIEDPTVDENTVGTYYTRRGIGRYIEVTLPEGYIAGTTYYTQQETTTYRLQEISTSPQPKRKYVDEMSGIVEQEGEAPEITVRVYDSDINYETMVDLYPLDNNTYAWLSSNMFNSIINEDEGSFTFIVKQNLPDEYSMYYTITQLDTSRGGML